MWGQLGFGADLAWAPVYCSVLAVAVVLQLTGWELGQSTLFYLSILLLGPAS